jgi:hypothetical protein
MKKAYPISGSFDDDLRFDRVQLTNDFYPSKCAVKSRYFIVY